MVEQDKITNGDKPLAPFVLISPKDRGFHLFWGFTTFTQKAPSGKLACYIPAFDLYFSAPSGDVVEQKAKAITKLFFDHYILHNGKNGLKSIALQLHKLGFKAPNDANTLHQLINNKVIKAKFKSLHNSPTGEFSNANRVDQESSMEVAC